MVITQVLMLSRSDSKEPQEGENPIALRIYPAITKFFENIPVGRVLDVGGGKGYLAHRLLKMGFDAYLCDIRDNNQFKDKIRWKHVNLDTDALPYTDRYFKYVVCCDVLEHCENPRRVIREITRVLDNGGMAVVSTPHTLSLPQRLYFLFTGKFLHFQYPYKLNKGQYGHITPVSLNLLRDEFGRVGAKIAEIRYDRGFLPVLRISMPKGFWFGDAAVVMVKKDLTLSQS